MKTTLTPTDMRRQLLADIAADNIYYVRGYRQLYEGQPGPLAAGAVAAIDAMMTAGLVEFSPGITCGRRGVHLTTLGKLRHAEWQKL